MTKHGFDLGIFQIRDFLVCLKTVTVEIQYFIENRSMSNCIQVNIILENDFRLIEY